jgi:hypothetical protein
VTLTGAFAAPITPELITPALSTAIVLPGSGVPMLLVRLTTANVLFTVVPPVLVPGPVVAAMIAQLATSVGNV